MRQIWITRAGAPEVLQVKEAPDPEPKAGEVCIRVEASGINFADLLGRMGIYPDLPPIPVVPGYEVSGRIDAVGAGVDGIWAGRDVIAMTRFGGYADTVCVPATQVFARPAGVSALEGAALPVNYFTAWLLVVVMGGLKGNETVLVHSVGGGVGIAATQIAKHLGARVIARPPLPSTPSYALWESTTSSITERRISRRGYARSPTAAESSLFSMPSAVTRGRRDIGFSPRRDGSACSAFPLRRIARSETFLRCCPCSRKRPGFSSIRFRS